MKNQQSYIFFFVACLKVPITRGTSPDVTTVFHMGGFRVQNKVVTNFCKIDTIYITIIALIFVAIIMIIFVVVIIIVNVASGDWSRTI